MPPLTSPSPTILIVEDEPSIASALTRLFTRDGSQTAMACNGQEALTACQRQAYTQILCDLWMPIFDGPGFDEALHRCQPQRCARVVFLTGDTLTPAVQALLACTQGPVLAKPFTAERLRALLSARCASPRPAGEARPAGTYTVLEAPRTLWPTLTYGGCEGTAHRAPRWGLAPTTRVVAETTCVSAMGTCCSEVTTGSEGSMRGMEGGTVHTPP